MSWKSCELRIGILHESLIVLTVDDEVEHWIQVSFTKGDKGDVKSVPDIEHDLRVRINNRPYAISATSSHTSAEKRRLGLAPSSWGDLGLDASLLFDN